MVVGLPRFCSDRAGKESPRIDLFRVPRFHRILLVAAGLTLAISIVVLIVRTGLMGHLFS